MTGITTGSGGAQLLETQVVHVRRDTGEPLGQILEGIGDVAHIRSLPAARRVATTGLRRHSLRIILRLARPAR